MNNFTKSELEEVAEKEENWKVLPATEILKMEARPVPFLIKGMIVESAINCISAETGEGKSLLALKMAEDIAAGRMFLEKFETKQTKTLLLDLEMDENTLIGRFKAFVSEQGAKNIGLIYGQTFDVEDKTLFELLTKTLEQDGYKLLIIDTLSSFHSREENSNSEMRFINKKLIELSHKGITILFLHHDRKPYRGEIKTKHSARGAVEIIAKSASQLILQSEFNRAEEKLVMTIKQGKVRLPTRCPSFQVSCKYNPETKKTDWKYMGVFQEEILKSERAKAAVLGFLKEKEFMTYEEMEVKASAEGLDLKRTNLRQAVRDLVKIGTFGSRTARKLEMPGREKYFYLRKQEDEDRKQSFNL